MSKALIGIIICVVIVAAGVGAYFVFVKDDSHDHSTHSRDTDQQESLSTSTNNTTPENNTQEPASETASVAIKNFAFVSAKITVKKGTVVTWTNEDSAAHNAFSEQEGGPKGDLLEKGESYSFKFDTVGTFNYICTPHPHMKGTVTVVE